MKFDREIRRLVRVQSLIFAASFLLAVWFDQQGWLTRLEYAIFDSRLTDQRQETILPEEIKVVLIDESSLAYMGSSLGQFPWPRTVYAQLIDFFASVGAKAVVFDILFVEPTLSASGNKTTSVHDTNLAAASARYDNVVHAALLTKDIDDVRDGSLNKPLPDYFASRFGLTSIVGDISSDQNSWSLPIEPISRATPLIGMVGLDPDNDGIYRRGRLLWSYQGRSFPSLSLAPVLLGELGQGMTLEQGQLTLLDQVIPLDEKNQILVNYYGDFQPYSIATIFQTIDEMERGDMSDLPLDPFSFEDSIIFVGASAIGLEDVKATPIDSKTPGVYIHASVAGNILTDDILKPATQMNSLLWLGGFILLAIGIAFYISNFTLQIIFLVSAPVVWWLYTSFQLLNNNQVFFVLPMFGLALGWSWSFTYLSFTEGVTKRRVKKMLTQYVSEEMLNQVLEKPDEILHAGGGHQEILTILFSDVRGFTKLSESLPATEVVKLLNCHFGEMSEVIFQNRGTLDKFIGDAIMAFWGAPIKVANHADLAIKAALEMIVAIDVVNKKLTEMSLPNITVGIGLNTGDVVLGNIGSDRKLDYTVIGDAVNVASRMEGITKMYGMPIIVSEATRMAVEKPRPFILLDHVRVKGKTERSAIYAPLPIEQEDPENYEKHLDDEKTSLLAYAYYQNQQWDEAEALYNRLNSKSLKALYLSRILEFRMNSPPRSWDGVYTVTTK